MGCGGTIPILFGKLCEFRNVFEFYVLRLIYHGKIYFLYFIYIYKCPLHVN